MGTATRKNARYDTWRIPPYLTFCSVFDVRELLVKGTKDGKFLVYEVDKVVQESVLSSGY